MKLTPLLFLLLIFPLLSSTQASADSSLTISDISSNKNEEIISSKENEPLPEPSKEPEEITDDDMGDIPEDEGEEEVVQIADPLYPWNKTMYHFNDKFYFWLMKPLAQGYSSVVPEDIRLSVSNFFDNITTPVRFVSNLLQLKVKDAGNELFRFLYNSTAGVCGFADAAKIDFDVRKKDEDLGQTMGSYGIGHGIYLVWPFLGPSSLRDTVGRVGDRFLTPINYINPTETAVGITVYDRVNETSFRIGDYEDLKKSAIDPYVSIRDAYVQHRKKKVED